MIFLNKRQYPSGFSNYDGYKIIIIIAFCCCTGFLCIMCSSLRSPKNNVFLNKANWDRRSYKQLSFYGKHLNLFLYAENFSQGKAIYIEVLPVLLTTKKNIAMEKKDQDFLELKYIHLSFKKKKNYDVILSYMEWGYRGFFGIHPNASLGAYEVIFSYVYKGQTSNETYTINITETIFPTFKKRKKLTFPKYSDVDQVKQKRIHDFIIRSSIKKKKMFRLFSEPKIEHEISHPRDQHYITSAFWTRRVYSRYKVEGRKNIILKPKISIHRGLDFRGSVGTPIYAMAGGEIAIAEKLYFEGNFTLIDHGNRIFSGYMHQTKIYVEEGDEVDAGEEIGTVGFTGRATGPHLHVFFKINGVYVDPLSMISLPIRH